MLRCVCFRGAIVALSVLLASSVVSAADVDEDNEWTNQTTTDFEPAREFWVGAEAFNHVWSLYTGSTFAPFGNLRQDGLRVRVVSTYGRYSYTGLRYDPTVADAVQTAFSANAQSTEALVGYQWSNQGLTAKAFVGAIYANNAIAPYDPYTKIQGPTKGTKAALELWYNVTNQSWTSLDLQYATAHQLYSARWRAGWRAGDAISFGPELSAVGHEENALRRLGTFVRYDDGLNEVTASAGYQSPRAGDASAYGTLQWLRRF